MIEFINLKNMKIVQITEKIINVDDLFFGKSTLHKGCTYLVHDLLLEGVIKQNWGTVVGTGDKLPHLTLEALKPGKTRTKALFLFHGGLGDAISVAILLSLVEKKYNMQIDISCSYDTWFYVFAPMGFPGKLVDFPVNITTINEYDFIQTDVTNFISDQTKRWEKCIADELAKAYQIDIAEFNGVYSIPGDILYRMKIPERKKIRIGVSFESKGAIRNYPDKLAHQLISAMVETGFEVHRFGTQSSGKISNSAMNGYYDYSGKTNIFEMAAFIKQMDLVIGMDSFLVHLANILGVRTIALLSTTKPGIFQWQKNVVCMASEIDCSPCGEVMNKCPLDYENCKAFYHESISPEQIMAGIINECRNLFKV